MCSGQKQTRKWFSTHIGMGDNCFCRFNGMWAVAIYDKQKDELLLCRDRFGELFRVT